MLLHNQTTVVTLCNARQKQDFFKRDRAQIATSIIYNLDEYPTDRATAVKWFHTSICGQRRCPLIGCCCNLVHRLKSCTNSAGPRSHVSATHCRLDEARLHIARQTDTIWSDIQDYFLFQHISKTVSWPSVTRDWIMQRYRPYVCLRSEWRIWSSCTVQSSSSAGWPL